MDSHKVGEPPPPEFEEELKKLLPNIYKLCVSILRDSHLAKDAVQEAAFTASRKWRNFESGRPMGPWLAAIARNKCLKILESRPRYAEEPIEEDDQGGTADPTLRRVDDVLIEAENFAAVHAAIEQLSEGEREAIELLVFEDLTAPEAAKRMGGTADALRRAKFRALIRLRELLRDHFEAQPLSV